jgi:hypothetical protein
MNISLFTQRKNIGIKKSRNYYSSFAEFVISRRNLSDLSEELINDCIKRFNLKKKNKFRKQFLTNLN